MVYFKDKIFIELIETFENLSILRQKWLEIFQNCGLEKAKSHYFQAFWKSLNKFIAKTLKIRRIDKQWLENDATM